MNTVKKKKKKGFLFYFLILVGVLILFAIIKKVTHKEEPTKVTVSQVSYRTIIETVSANGKIQPEKEVKISSDVSGEIVDLYIKEGDSVVKGQLLCRINPEIYVTSLDRANASLNNARAQLASSKARQAQADARFNEVRLTYDRNKKLYDQKVLSESEFEASKSAFLNAQAEVEASKQSIKAAEYTVASFDASVSEANKSLKRTEIFAPVSGIISRLNVEKGERVVGTSQMAGTEMMRIANLIDMEARVEVNENDIIRVSAGDTATVEIDAYLDRKFKGIVTEVANSANLTGVSADQVTNFTVKIRLLKSSYTDLISKSRAPFRPGMSASVEVQTNIAKNVACVPVVSVTSRDKKSAGGNNKDKDGKNSEKKETADTKDQEEVKDEDLIDVVFIYKDGKAIMREVKYGIQDQEYIQILKGISPKEEVIDGPYNVISKKLKDGDPVMKVTQKELFDATTKKSGPPDSKE